MARYFEYRQIHPLGERRTTTSPQMSTLSAHSTGNNDESCDDTSHNKNEHKIRRIELLHYLLFTYVLHFNTFPTGILAMIFIFLYRRDILIIQFYNTYLFI